MTFSTHDPIVDDRDANLNDSNVPSLEALKPAVQTGYNIPTLQSCTVLMAFISFISSWWHIN